jgi:hypothetical protein
MVGVKRSVINSLIETFDNTFLISKPYITPSGTSDVGKEKTAPNLPPLRVRQPQRTTHFHIYILFFFIISLHTHPPALLPSPPSNPSHNHRNHRKWRSLQCRQPPRLPMHAFDIVPIWIQHIRRIVAGCIFPLTWRAVTLRSRLPVNQQYTLAIKR